MRTATVIASALLVTALVAAPVATALETTDTTMISDPSVSETGPCVSINPDPQNPVDVYECPQS